MGVKKTIKKREQIEYGIEEVFEIFQREKLAYGIATPTVQNYYISIQRLTTSLQVHNPKVQDFDKSDILEFINSLQSDGIRTASINHYLRDIRAFFNWCYKEGYINNKIDVKLIKEQETIKETYTDEELKKLLAPPTTNNYCAWRSWAIVNWILATGNREKTICNIRIGDLNLQEQEILLQQTKNKKPQIIPMSSELSFILKRFIKDFRSEAAPEDYLFCNVAGEKLTENALKLSIFDYNHSRDVNRTSVHALRHTFAKYWIRNNGDVFRLQKMLGHSSLEMTRRYVNMFSADLKEGFDNFSPLDNMMSKTGLKHKIRRKQQFAY